MTLLSARHRRPEPQPRSLGWVIARIDRQGRVTLTSAGVYDLREDAEHALDQCRQMGHLGWTYCLAFVVPEGGDHVPELPA